MVSQHDITKGERGKGGAREKERPPHDKNPLLVKLTVGLNMVSAKGSRDAMVSPPKDMVRYIGHFLSPVM